MEGSNKKQNKKTKSSYSLRELIPEITGASKLDYNFGAEYKAVERIVKAMKKFTGNNQKNMRISHEEKDAFVIINRNLYNMIKKDSTGEGQKLFTRMSSDEDLTAQEYDKLIKIFKEGFEANPDLPLNKMLLDRANNEDKFYQLKDEIEQQIVQDINFLFIMESSSLREKRVKEYLSILKESSQLKTWREDVQSDLQEESIKRRIISIANEKKMDVQAIMEGKDTKGIEELLNEIVKRDVEKYIKDVKETDL